MTRTFKISRKIIAKFKFAFVVF